MPKQLVLTGLGNRIEYANTNGKGLITGKRQDITDDAIAIVFEHMMREYKKLLKDEPNKENFSYSYKGFGKITFTPENKF